MPELRNEALTLPEIGHTCELKRADGSTERPLPSQGGIRSATSFELRLTSSVLTGAEDGGDGGGTPPGNWTDGARDRGPRSCKSALTAGACGTNTTPKWMSLERVLNSQMSCPRRCLDSSWDAPSSMMGEAVWCSASHISPPALTIPSE